MELFSPVPLPLDVLLNGKLPVERGTAEKRQSALHCWQYQISDNGILSEGVSVTPNDTFRLETGKSHLILALSNRPFTILPSSPTFLYFSSSGVVQNVHYAVAVLSAEGTPAEVICFAIARAVQLERELSADALLSYLLSSSYSLREDSFPRLNDVRFEASERMSYNGQYQLFRPTNKRPSNALYQVHPELLPPEPWPSDIDSWSSGALIKKFEPICSQITNQIYLGSRIPASDIEILQKNGITHILNAASTICEDSFPDRFVYKSVPLMDESNQEIRHLLPELLGFIDNAIKQNGKVYVHCHQGISRSASIVIGYLMWRFKWSYMQALDYVKTRRFVVSPNSGFLGQLLEFRKALDNGSVRLEG